MSKPRESKILVRAIQDKIVIHEPEHFVQLRITLNGASETILCPHDFDVVIEELRHHRPGFESFQIYGTFPAALQRLGMLSKTARGSWYGTKLFHEHADALEKAFTARWNKMTDDGEH